MAAKTLNALTVRFTPELREKLELIADREHRPSSNQVVHFVALGIDDYLQRNDLEFEELPDGGWTIRSTSSFGR